MGRPQAVLIAGPTASGKSALALFLAQRFGGCIINADSMQVYSDLRVLSARPPCAEEALAPHLLFGHVDGAVNYSVGAFMADAGAAIETARAKGLLPIFVGGTGMYFKALTQGLSDIPATPALVRDRVRALADTMSVGELHALLCARDPVMGVRLRPSDPQRILRALEVIEATGTSLAEFQGARRGQLLDADSCVCFFKTMERGALTARIDARFDAMMREGALEEVKALASRRLDRALPVMRAHGVPGILSALSGEIELSEAIERGKRDTRRYAKRQLTFARHNLPFMKWMADEAPSGSVSELAEAEIEAAKN